MPSTSSGDLVVNFSESFQRRLDSSPVKNALAQMPMIKKKKQISYQHSLFFV